ncbi:MAG: hypothetical protein ACRDLT_13345 [Solirubrobacteraceae bacterium]
MPVLALAPVLVLCIWVTVSAPYTNSPPIRSDGAGYYAWTEAILHWNFDFCDLPKMNGALAQITAGNPEHPDRCELKYEPGLALLRFPVMGPVAALANGDDKNLTHVSTAEEKASQWLSVLALLATITFMGASMRRLGVGRLLTAATLLIATFGTGLFHYATYDSSYTHIYTAMLVATLVYLGVRAHQLRQRPSALLVFGISFFVVLIREIDVVPLVLLEAAWLLRPASPSAWVPRMGETVKAALPAVIGIALAVGLQTFYNHWASGRWALSSYGSESLSLSELREGSVLASYDHGLLLWYPAMVVLLIVPLLRARSRRWGVLGLVMVVPLVVIYGSWNPWWLGGAFGQRGMVDVVPVVAVGGAVGLAALRPRGRALAIGLCVICAFVTLELMSGYWTGTLPFDHDTSTQYWRNVAGSDSVFSP